MNNRERLKLQRMVAIWSDGHGLAQATALAEKHRHLLPKRITNAQLSGLNGLVQAGSSLTQVMGFAQHQGGRAARAGRVDVKGYWDDLREALGRLEGEADRLLTQAGVPVEGLPSKLTLWLAQEFVQHLVAHSLYLGVV